MKNKRLEKQKIESILLRYSLGEGTEKIAKDFNIHASTVQKYLKRGGLLKAKQKYTHDRTFFDTYTKESCYWAGMMMSDGYVRSDRHMIGLHLQDCDHEHLRTFLKTINANHQLIRDKTTNAYCVQIYGRECKESLIKNFNVVPNKSKITSYPTLLPNDMHSHFIRGIMDGDGSITLTTCPTVSFVGSVDLLHSINDIIIDNANIVMRTKKKEQPTICIPNKNKLWFGMLSFYGKTAAQALKWIYRDSTPQTRLWRKYEIYHKLFNDYLELKNG